MQGIETIRECLPQMDPKRLDYAQWLQVGSAIKYEGGTMEEWDAWSRNDDRYKETDCRSRWDGLDKGSEPVTVATVVRLCKECGGTPPRCFRVDDEDEEIPMDRPVSMAEEGALRPQARRAKDPEKIVRKEWMEKEQLPTDLNLCGSMMLKRYLETLFSEEEHVGYVAKAIQTAPDAEGNRRWVPDGKGVYCDTAGSIIRRLEASPKDLGNVIGDWEDGAGAWIRFNPLDGQGVADKNVTAYRYALVESDDMDIETQYTIMRRLELPIAALVHSGRKSLHAIVRIDAEDFREYRRRVDRLYEICNKNGMKTDMKNRNPSRLSRMPGVTRNGVVQRLVALNIGQPSWKSWEDWIAAQDDDLPEFEDISSIWDAPPALAECIIEGVLRKGHKMLVSGPSKAGKSFLLLELANAMAEGGEWLGWKCRKGRVLYINLELDRSSCMRRVMDIYARNGDGRPEPGTFDVWNLRGKAVPMDQLMPKLVRRAMKTRPDAIILDPIYKVITGDENAADQMARFCNQFDAICREIGCACIYCHHHSKGDQGQKAAQDRASGSGVFARDPDALIDIVELEIDDKRREQIQYKYSVRDIQGLLGRTAPDWKDDFSEEPEDAEKLDKLLEYARRKAGADADGGNLADKANAESIRSSRAMTGWRISGILREFPSFEDRFAFFRYPLHDCSDMASALLQDCKAKGEITHMTRDERIKAGIEAGKKLKDETNAETRMAFEALNDGKPVTTERVAEYLGISERGVQKRMKNAGFTQPKGTKGIWFAHGAKTNANNP